MPEKESVVEKQDLSRFGKKKKIKKGDKVVINADVVGLGVGCNVEVTEVRHGGAQFRVVKLGGKTIPPERDFLIWANQID